MEQVHQDSTHLPDEMSSYRTLRNVPIFLVRQRTISTRIAAKATAAAAPTAIPDQIMTMITYKVGMMRQQWPSILLVKAPEQDLHLVQLLIYLDQQHGAL